MGLFSSCCSGGKGKGKKKGEGGVACHVDNLTFAMEYSTSNPSSDREKGGGENGKDTPRPSRPRSCTEEKGKEKGFVGSPPSCHPEKKEKRGKKGGNRRVFLSSTLIVPAAFPFARRKKKKPLPLIPSGGGGRKRETATFCDHLLSTQPLITSKSIYDLNLPVSNMQKKKKKRGGKKKEKGSEKRVERQRPTEFHWQGVSFLVSLPFITYL